MKDRLYLNCYTHAFIFTFLVDEFSNAKTILTAIFDKIAMTLQSNQVMTILA